MTPALRPGRRRMLLMTAAAVVAAAAPLRADECLPFLQADLDAITPEEALQRLWDGNARFAGGRALGCDPLVAARGVAARQSPFACVLACIDSRSAPELVLDQQGGDLFVARVAGNAPNAEVLGSFEYATEVVGAKAILVLGHNHCGAMKGAIDRPAIASNLTALLDGLQPSVDETPLEGERSSHNEPFLDAVTETNVRRAVAGLLERSPLLQSRVDAGLLVVAGAIYDVDALTVRRVV